MTAAKYDGLPAEQKAAIDAIAGAALSKSAEDAWNVTANAALETARASADNTIVDLTADEAAAFSAAVADVVNKYVASVGGEATLAKMQGN